MTKSRPPSAPAPKTLLQLAGAEPKPARLAGATVIVIDAQNEYLDGTIPLPGIDAALDEIAALQARAHAAQAPVLHVQHVGRPGGLFDITGHGGRLIERVAPDNDEDIVLKSLPNAFAHTVLADTLAELGRTHLIVVGFMTHMCVSATVRAALDHGYITTVVASACAARALPDPLSGAAIAADTVHRTALAELYDRFAAVARTVADIPD